MNPHVHVLTVLAQRPGASLRELCVGFPPITRICIDIAVKDLLRDGAIEVVAGPGMKRYRLVERGRS